MMAEYDPMNLAVPKMDDNSPANMSTVFNDTEVTKTVTLTMMVAPTTMGTTLTYNLWPNFKYKCR